MIDFHSHILPNVDDGSKSVAESLAMLNLLKAQGITKVVFTPHFYANDNSVSEFAEKRRQSYEVLKKEMTPDLPEVFLGAEVKYYEGISRLDGLPDLCIGDTKLLLLEMTSRRWTDYTLKELSELSSSGRVTVVLAHIERYLSFQPKGLFEELAERGIMLQTNADFFLSIGSRHKAFSMLKKGLIHFIGSDCHNLAHRSPRIGDAYSLIGRKMGEGFIKEMDSFMNSYLI